MESALRACANCRVLVQPAGDFSEAWEHVPAFAEKFTRSVCDDPQPGRPASGSEARFGMSRIKTPSGDKHVIKDQLPGSRYRPGDPVTVAVDGSYKLFTGDRVIKPMSWGYLITSGSYGLGTSIVPGKLVGGRVRAGGDDPERTLQAELRGIANALQVIERGTLVTILAVSQDALGFVNFWRDGYEIWPRGYDPERSGGRESTLGRLARRAREDRDVIRTEWVRGRSGHPLNEAADALARAARRWTTTGEDKAEVANRARRIAAGGLNRYHAFVG